MKKFILFAVAALLLVASQSQAQCIGACSPATAGRFTIVGGQVGFAAVQVNAVAVQQPVLLQQNIATPFAFNDGLLFGNQFGINQSFGAVGIGGFGRGIRGGRASVRVRVRGR